jgi:hypothetical protein
MSFSEPAIPLTALTPYLGRFVWLVVSKGSVITTVKGFLTEIRSCTFVIDDIDYIDQKYVLRAYNIANELIAGSED